jgi:hypothetical protein
VILRQIADRHQKIGNFGVGQRMESGHHSLGHRAARVDTKLPNPGNECRHPDHRGNYRNAESCLVDPHDEARATRLIGIVKHHWADWFDLRARERDGVHSSVRTMSESPARRFVGRSFDHVGILRN